MTTSRDERTAAIPRTAGPPDRARRWLRASGPALLGLGLGVLALGPGLRRGFILRYDMIFVPDPPFTAATLGWSGGPSRGVPSDAVVALLATVMPADLVQKIILLAVFVLAAAGAARLLPRDAGSGARLVAAACYAWNPYLAERLLIGQWALLLGYAGLPFAVHAAIRFGRGRGPVPDTLRLAAALLPAAVGGFAALTISAPVLLAVALLRRVGRWTAAACTVAVLAVLATPWLAPSLLRTSTLHSDPAGAGLFAARADTPFGALGSLLALGGIWNREVVPSGYGTGPVALLGLGFVLLGVAGHLLPGHRPGRAGLVAGAAVGYAIAALGVFGAGRGVLRRLIEADAAFAVLRDGQRFIAPLALLAAVGLGLLTVRVVAACRARAAAGAGAMVAALGVLAPVLLLPTFALGAVGRLEAVRYPDDWTRARAIMAADPTPGAILVLPWTAYRGFGWNDGRTMLDPAPSFFGRPVVWNDGLRVGDRHLAPESPRARSVSTALRRGAPAKAARGVRYLLVEHQHGQNENKFRKDLPATKQVLAGTDISLYRLVTSPW